MPAGPAPLHHACSLWDSGRRAEALLIFNQLASQNEPQALFLLANIKWSGGAGPPDPAQGRDLLRRAGEAGHSEAGFLYTNLLASGVAGARDWPRAMERLREEARQDQRRRTMLDLLGEMQLDAEGSPSEVPLGEKLSTSPHVTIFRGLLSPRECDYLKRLAEPLLQPSMVYDGDRKLVRDPIRTSDGGTIHWLIEDPAVHALNRRLGAVTGTSADQGEALQILRYRPGQQYRSHLDFARASDNHRVLTALVYLNQEYKGGETHFVKTGLKVQGRKGDALIFRNAAEDRTPDPMSEHAGMPVTGGTKYLASRWIREKRWTP
jgi:prolyl 4-hydroxylase